MADFPSTTSAYGIWSLQENRDAEMGDNWPEVIIEYDIDLLLVAGGGSGGTVNPYSTNSGCGGGGAGGFRNLTSQTISSSTVYTVTVGAGGVRSNSSVDRGRAGDNSSFVGTGFSESSTGGGGGGSQSDATSRGGGSSGGTFYGGTIGTPNAGGYTPVEGYTGYAGANNGVGGGGGGAGAAATSGNGGSGASSSITGSSVTYAGGGGGGQGSGAAAGSGVNGGGNGATTNGVAGCCYGSPGTANTGGGGGGGGYGSESLAGNGGSGIVILRIPTANYSGTTTGSPSVATDGSYTVLTYNSSGSYTG